MGTNELRADESAATATSSAVLEFADGEAQVVKEFEDSDLWIRHDLWVETEFDTDGDGKLDAQPKGAVRGWHHFDQVAPF